MRFWLVGVAALSLGGCSSGPEPFTLPDGRIGHTAMCDGVRSTMAECYQAASDVCKGPYEVVGQDQNARVYGSNGNVGSSMRRSMYFTCEVAPKGQT